MLLALLVALSRRSTTKKITLPPTTCLSALIQILVDGDLRLKKPSITSDSATLYMQAPPALEKMTNPNLRKQISELMDSGEELTVTDPVFPGDKSLPLIITFMAE